MLSKSFKIIAVGASFAGLVACGKGVGEKNNRVIDGAYVQQKTVAADGKATELSQMVNIVDIKDGVRTQYRVNTVMNRVQITKDRLIIKGSSIIGVENIEDKCIDQNELGVHPEQSKISQKSGNLILQKGSKKTVLKPYSKAELTALVEQIEAGKYEIACFDLAGNKISNPIDDKDAKPTTVEEDEAKKEATTEESAEATEVKSEEGTDADNLQKQVEPTQATEVKSAEGTNADNLEPKKEEAAKETTSSTATASKKTVLN